jgi:hypothetical protein
MMKALDGSPRFEKALDSGWGDVWARDPHHDFRDLGLLSLFSEHR